MTNFDMAELANTISVYDLACKTIDGIALDDTESTVVAQFDEWAREIGRTGHDQNHEIASYITRVVNEQLYSAPEEVLDLIFDRGSIGETDDYEAHLDPKNTLVAYEAAQGGNVDRSYIDISVITPKWRNRQVETDISFADLRKNGWKSVALLTEYAVEELKKQMFIDVFSAIDAVITSGAANYISETGAKPTATSMDAMSLYLLDRASVGEGVIVGPSKYIQAASKLTGFASESMKDSVNKRGFLGDYDGCPMKPISAAVKSGNGTALLPAQRLYGVAGKIGTLDMKGTVHVYQSEDINNERIHIKIADFTYGYAMNAASAEKMCKIVMAS